LQTSLAVKPRAVLRLINFSPNSLIFKSPPGSGEW
jgi:hypothetical protein